MESVTQTDSLAHPSASTPDEERTQAELRRQFEKAAVPVLDELYRQALRYTHNQDDAEDLVQATFERGFKAFGSFRQGTNIAAWLTTIMRNTYFNEYQKRRRRPVRANDQTGDYNDWDIYGASDHTGTGLRSAEDMYLDSQTPPEIIKALDGLSPERRAVFVAAAIEGKSYKEIAKEQGIKIGTVMSRLNRARAQLREELAPYVRSGELDSGIPASSIRSESPSGKSEGNLRRARPAVRGSGKARNNSRPKAVGSTASRKGRD